MIILIPILILHLLMLVNSQFTAWPEMLSYPYLFVNGFNLYSDYVIPYPPGLTLILALIYKIFGSSPEVLKYATWVLILAIDICLFFLLKKISKSDKIAWIALAFFVVLQVLLDGNMLWFEIGFLLPTLLTFINFSSWLDTKKIKYLIFSGIFLTLGLLIKQTVLFYIIGLAIFYLSIRRKIIIAELFKILILPSVLLSSFLIYLISINSFLDFWNWNIYYPLFVWSKFPGYGGFHISIKDLITTGIIFLPAIFLFKRNILRHEKLLLTITFITASVLAIYPRLVFFHLQPVLAFLVIGYLQIFLIIKGNFKKAFLLVVLFSFILATYILSRNFSFTEGTRFYDETDKKTSQIIQSTVSDRKVFLLGLYSSYYVYSDTLPPKPWVDNFGWYFEVPGVQEKVISGLSSERIEFVFIKKAEHNNWYEIGTYQPQKVMDFIKENYELNDVINSEVEVWQIKK